MSDEKQKDDMQRILEGIIRIEYPQDKYRDARSLDVRPILPMDLGLDTWIWRSDKVKLQPRWYLALYGIYSSYLLQVAFRTGSPGGNMVAVVSTGQLLYEPYLWKKQEELWVTWKPLEKTPFPSRPISFSILGFIIEPAGTTVA